MPSLASTHEEKIDSAKGLKIVVRSWSPASTPRAVVVICHGVRGVRARESGELAGFICESFAFQVPAPGVALAAIKAVSHIAPRPPVLTLKNEDFSRDPKAVEALNNDPLTAHESQPAITVAALVRADERLRQQFPSITLPVLIMHGTGPTTRPPCAMPASSSTRRLDPETRRSSCTRALPRPPQRPRKRAGHG